MIGQTPLSDIALRRLLVLMALVTLAMAASACLPGTGGTEPKEVANNFPIVLYQGVEELGAVEVTLAELRGKPVVVNFWAGLCPPCRAEMPEFQEFQDQFQGRVLLIGVDLGQFMHLGTKEDARQLLAELGVSYAAGYTDQADVVQEYRVLGLPTTVFIDREGKLHRKWDGILNREKLAELAEELLE